MDNQNNSEPIENNEGTAQQNADTDLTQSSQDSSKSKNENTNTEHRSTDEIGAETTGPNELHQTPEERNDDEDRHIESGEKL